MPEAARLATRYAPPRLVSSTDPKVSSSIRSSSWSAVIPALATSTSTLPCSASTAEKAASTSTAEVTSHLTASSPSGGGLPR